MSSAHRPLVGIALVALATLSFALGDTLTKSLSTRAPIPVLVAGRYLISLAILIAAVMPRKGSALWRTRRTALVLLRGGVLALASLTMGYALNRMPVGEAVAVINLAPFLVLLLAAPILGEKVGPGGWLGATLGFCGVILILRPGAGLDPLGVALALLNAGLATCYNLLSRALSATESTLAMLFHVTLVGAVVFTVTAVAAPGPVPLPSLPDALLIALLGCLATLGHFLFTAAFREAPASTLAPVTYLHIVWATLLGLFVFRHLPDALALIGMALVCLAGAIVAISARRPPRAV